MPRWSGDHPAQAGDPLIMAWKRGWRLLLRCLLGLAAANSAGRARGDDPACHHQAIFAPEDKHNHASCVIQTARGDLLAAWYSGTGEKGADDVVIQGAWLARGSQAWGPRFLLADTPGYPDCNPALFAAPEG